MRGRNTAKLLPRGGHLGDTGDTECTSQHVGKNRRCQRVFLSRRRVCRSAGSVGFTHALRGTFCTPCTRHARGGYGGMQKSVPTWGVEPATFRPQSHVLAIEPSDNLTIECKMHLCTSRSPYPRAHVCHVPPPLQVPTSAATSPL
jgi:hypothetical protein